MWPKFFFLQLTKKLQAFLTFDCLLNMHFIDVTGSIFTFCNIYDVSKFSTLVRVGDQFKVFIF